MKGDPFFRAMTTPVVKALVSRVPAPRSAKATRRAMTKAMGRPVTERYSDAYFEMVRAGMAMPGWKLAMSSHLNLAMRSGKARPENLLSDDELRSIQTPVLFVMGDADVYGPPAVCERAAALMPDARVEVLPGGHAPFLDDPARCASLVVSRLLDPDVLVPHVGPLGDEAAEQVLALLRLEVDHLDAVSRAASRPRPGRSATRRPPRRGIANWRISPLQYQHGASVVTITVSR